MRPLKWGIIGCGDIVRRRIAPAMNTLGNCEITGVARRHPDALEACREKMAAGRGFKDWRDLVTPILTCP